MLKTRVTDYVKYFVNGEKLNKKWAKDIVVDIENKNDENILINIKRFLKDYLTEEDNTLAPKELLIKYVEEIDSISKYDKETQVFGFYNTWWVFGEVAKELDYDIFMAEAEINNLKNSKQKPLDIINKIFGEEFSLGACHFCDEYKYLGLAEQIQRLVAARILSLF